MLRIIHTLIFIMAVTVSQAQVQKIVIGVNGLTCSQCSKSVYKKLEILPFIQHIDMDLNTHTATILLKNENDYNIEKLAHAITEAGYSVRNINILFKKEALKFNKNHWIHNGYKFYYLSEKHTSIPENFTAEILGKRYNSDRKINKLIPDDFISMIGKSYFVIIK